MKGGHKFAICVFLFLILVFVLECHVPRRFVWRPTYSHWDRQPFGCALFDSLLSSSLPGGYSLSQKTFWVMNQEADTLRRRGILVVGESLSLQELDVTSLLAMVERGDRALLVSNEFGYLLEDTLGLRTGSNHFQFASLRRTASLVLKDTLWWVDGASAYPRQAFHVYPPLCTCALELRDSDASVLLENERDSRYFAVSVKWGKGEIVLASLPLLFTNYGVVDGPNAALLFRLLSRFGSLPVVRTEGYGEKELTESVSPLRHFLWQRPLRWALYVGLAGIVLFMGFTARRRQRAIPVVRAPENRSLEFVKLIGTLYFQQGNHTDLVRKKFVYFAEELRREIQVDVEEAAEDERNFARIARKTGLELAEVSAIIRNVHRVLYEERALTVRQMKQLIDQMNRIINHL